jgi:hypothetical protein
MQRKYEKKADGCPDHYGILTGGGERGQTQAGLLRDIGGGEGVLQLRGCCAFAQQLLRSGSQFISTLAS